MIREGNKAGRRTRDEVSALTAGKVVPDLLITVVTACWNSAETIAWALDSVAGQMYGPKEHLIIDGLSTDRTMDVISAKSGTHIRVLSERDRGVYDAMNRGIREARGDVIGFLNADDLYSDRQVLSDVALKFSDPKVDAVFGDLDYVTGDLKRVVRCWKSRPFILGDIGRGWLPPHPTLFIRRPVYQRLGGFDLSYGTAADFDLMNRFFTRGRICSVHIPRTLVHMRIGGMSNHSWRAVARAQFQNARSLISTFGMVPPAYPFLKLADRLRQFRRAKKLNERKSHG